MRRCCTSLAARATMRSCTHAILRAPPQSRKFSSIAPQNTSVGDALWRSEGPLHVIGGVAFFVAAERFTAGALAACDLNLPASVTALCALGAVAAVPRAGTALQRALGPATAWMRASLPVVLVPAFLFPAVCDLPEREALPKLALLCCGGIVLTCSATGHIIGVGTPLAMPSEGRHHHADAHAKGTTLPKPDEALADAAMIGITCAAGEGASNAPAAGLFACERGSPCSCGGGDASSCGVFLGRE